MWLTRDIGGNLELWHCKPIKTASGGWKGSYEGDVEYMLLDEDEYPEVTFENSPIECSLLSNDYLQNIVTEAHDDGYHDGLLDGREGRPEWHKYPDEKPKLTKLYQVTLESIYGNVFTDACQYDSDFGEWDMEIPFKVLAWMELSEPYEPIKGIDTPI